MGSACHNCVRNRLSDDKVHVGDPECDHVSTITYQLPSPTLPFDRPCAATVNHLVKWDSIQRRRLRSRRAGFGWEDEAEGGTELGDRWRWRRRRQSRWIRWELETQPAGAEDGAKA